MNNDPEYAQIRGQMHNILRELQTKYKDFDPINSSGYQPDKNQFNIY